MDMMSLRRRVMVNQNKLMTATGNPITFNTPLEKPLKECVIKFTPKQEGSGTPSPENVREIVGKTSITVYQQGDDGVTHETSVSFPSTVGDSGVVYGGYLDAEKGEVVAEWTKVDMGDLNWRLYEKCWSCIPSGIKTHSTASSQVADLVCDIYEQGRVTTASQFRNTPEGQLVARNDYKSIGIKDSTYTTAADFNTAVTGHYLAYKLAEPIHYPLSPRILTTLQGNNVMWSDANGDISVKYWTR